MKCRIPLFALCALSLLACDDSAAPDAADLGASRDRAVLGDPVDATVPFVDAGDPDDGIPLLEPEPDPEPDPNPEPDPDPEPEPEPGGPCEPGETRLCVESCGVATCVDGRFGPCNPATELCNAHDDNCDGRQDEGYAGLGVGCVVDQNGCSSQGTRICAADQRSVFCDAPPAMPSPEVCDGDDDDCDGRVDEDFPGRICCSDDLQCGPGETCENGECTGGVGPGPDPEPDPGQQCRDDFDCFFQTCVQGVCRDGCFTDLDCGPGEFCDFFVCMPGGPQPECVIDADCFGFEVCQAGSCVPPQAPPCVDDAECPGLQTCQGGVCALPPGISSCDNTVAMDAFGVYRASNVGSPDSFGATCGQADNGPEQVFEFTLEINAEVTVDTVGSNFDTVLNVLDACPGGAELACDDDIAGGNLQSAVSFRASAGTTYFVAVHGYDDAEAGDIVVNFAGVEICVADAECPEGQACVDGVCEVPPCMANADCPAGELCRDGVCGPAGQPLCADDADCPAPQICRDRLCALPDGFGSCDLAVALDGFGQYRGSNVGAPNSVDAGCVGADGPEQVFELTLETSAEVTVNTVGSDFDTVLSVRDACPDGVELACHDDISLGNGNRQSRVTFEAMAGATYFVAVHGFNAGAQGAITLNVDGVEICLADAECGAGEACVARSCVCAEDVACPGDQVCRDGICREPPPPILPCDDMCGGDCANAICIPAAPAACAGATLAEAVPGAWNGDTDGLLNRHDAGCTNTGNAPDDILVIALPDDADVTVSTAGSDFDTVLYVLEACDPANEVACNDDGPGLQSELTFRAQAGVAYYIVVDGYNGASGAFDLTVDVR